MDRAPSWRDVSRGEVVARRLRPMLPEVCPPAGLFNLPILNLYPRGCARNRSRSPSVASPSRIICRIGQIKPVSTAQKRLSRLLVAHDLSPAPQAWLLAMRRFACAAAWHLSQVICWVGEPLGGGGVNPWGGRPMLEGNLQVDLSRLSQHARGGT